SDAPDLRGPSAASHKLGLISHNNRFDIHGCDLGLAPTQRGDLGGREEVGAIALFQRVNDDAELGIGQNTGKSRNRRGTYVLTAVSQTAGQNVVRRQRTNRSGWTGKDACGI